VFKLLKHKCLEKNFNGSFKKITKKKLLTN
jgi:hypothetical protein